MALLCLFLLFFFQEEGEFIVFHSPSLTRVLLLYM